MERGGNMDIIRKVSTVNTTEAVGREIKYIVVHYTAGLCSGAGAAQKVADWFDHGPRQASADFIVDDETTIQYNPDPANRYCWSVGGPRQETCGGTLYGIAGNANSVSVEICSTNHTGQMTQANDPAWSYTDAVLDRAAKLIQYLMKTYHVDSSHVIRHYDVNGKLCPGIIGWNAETGDESKWEAFRKRLEQEV